MRFLRVLCVLALVALFTASAYAETQSVKVSGDLTMRGFYRYAYDYRGSVNETPTNNAGNRTGATSADQSWWMSTAEIEVDADLTDNVATVIRLVNQRDWNVRTKAVNQNTTLAVNGNGGYTAITDEFDVMVDLAYVTLKDFIYSPLTLTIGRQDLWLGKGFIIGANQQNPAQTVAGGGGGNLSAPEYTAINSFDAIKAVLDYDPWAITALYSNIYENIIGSNDGQNLFGVNVGYKFDAYKGEAEGYWFSKLDKQVDRWSAIKSNNDVHTFGLRGSFDPIDIVTVALEGAYQCGSYLGNRSQVNNRDRSAYAIDASAECRYWMEKFAWKPKVGIEYVLYSGDEPSDNPAQAAGDYTGWDPMYRGKFDSAIREFVGRFYASAEFPMRTNYTVSSADASFTNQQQLVFMGSIQPIESLTLKGNYNIFWTETDYLAGNSKSGGFVGQEVDLNATWDYTEDVSFGLLAGWFIPGEVYQHSDKTATDIVGTVKVSF